MPSRFDIELPKGDALNVVMTLTQRQADGTDAPYDLTDAISIVLTVRLDAATSVTYSVGAGITVSAPPTLGIITVRFDGDDFPAVGEFPWALKITPSGSNDTDTPLYGDLIVTDVLARLETLSTGATCTPWATEADLCSPCNDYSNVGTLAAEMLQAASDVLFELSGRQFPGACEMTIRPEALCSHAERHVSLPMSRRSAGGGCGCANYRFSLPDYPVVAISQVKVDGAVVDPALYRLDDNRTLVRLADADGSNPGWPTAQRLDLPTTAEDTWSITYSWGRPPPPMGVKAAAVLACELALACDPETVSQCRLPKTATSVTREGVSVVLSPSDFLDKDGKVGLYEVDLFLRAVNPERIRRRASVWHAGMGRSVRP